MLETSHNAVLLYDLFGRVTIINPTMEKLLQDNDLPPFELTALDMLTRLAQIEIGHSRQLLQEVIQQERNLTLLVDLADTYYELKVSALLVKEDQELGYSGGEPFSVQGILFELKEMSSAKEKEQYHARLVKHLFHLIQNDLESIYMATSLLEQDSTAEEKQYLSEILKEKKINLNEVLDRARHFLQQADGAQVINTQYPLDTCVVIDKAIQAYQKSLPANKKISIRYQFIEYSELGMADPTAIPTLIDLLLEILLDDATENSVISIQFQEREKYLVYRFSNQGFGMPQERLDDLLKDSDSFKSDVFQQLNRMIYQVRRWDGRLTCRSQLGKGIEFLLVFKRFI
jgi:signal transduction histidine kinase